MCSRLEGNFLDDATAGVERRLANTSSGGPIECDIREEAQKDIQTLVAQLSKTNFIASDSLTI